MGAGYSVSPLHRVVYLDTSVSATRPIVKGADPVLDTLAKLTGTDTVHEGTFRTRSPTVADILAWRERITSKYSDQLGEELAWDERSTFEVSEDAGTSGDVLLRYAAAVLDQRGKSGFSNLFTTGKPTSQQIDAVFAEASRRGFGGRFPQLLLGARVWLPFETNLMIEEPNWNGVLARYGSAFCLADEVTSVRAAIAEAYPAVATYDATKDSSEQPMVDAWQTSDTILRLAEVAVSRHLPIWTTG